MRERGRATSHQDREREWRGHWPTPGRRPCRAPSGGSPPGAPPPPGRAAPLPQAGSARRNGAADAAPAQIRPGPSSVPGILLPCKITVKGAPCGRVARDGASATLECDLPGKTRHLSEGRGKLRCAPWSNWALYAPDTGERLMPCVFLEITAGPSEAGTPGALSMGPAGDGISWHRADRSACCCAEIDCRPAGWRRVRCLEGEGEGGALADRALGPDASTVAGHDLAHRGEAYAGAGELAVVCRRWNGANSLSA